MPRVSVLVPCYNCARHLPEAIESALAQTYDDFELILVDDGSRDETFEIIERYCAQYPDRIQAIRQENQGCAAARNTAIAHARGELFALLDSDDVWLPERLAVSVAEMDRRPQVGLVHSNIIRVDENGRRLGVPERDANILSGRIFEHLYTRRAHISCPTALFRRECVERVGAFDPELSRLGCEDRDLWLRIAREYDIHYIPQVLALYRTTSGSMSHQTDRMMRAREYVLKKYDDGSPHMRRLRREASAQIYMDWAWKVAAAGDKAGARAWWWRTLTACPFRWRFVRASLVGLARSLR